MKVYKGNNDLYGIEFLNSEGILLDEKPSHGILNNVG